MSRMNIMDQTGHSTLDWTDENKEAVARATDKFNELIGRGYSAFKVGADKQSTRINSFDPHAEEITMVPQLVGG